MDVNTACTSFLYGLSTATAMIRTGVVRNALVIGVEMISPFMDWENRNVAVLFGDGCAAVVLQATDRDEGVLAEKLGCYADARAHPARARHGHDLRATATSASATPRGTSTARRSSSARSAAWRRRRSTCSRRPASRADEIDLVVPHQANLRIIESVAKRVGVPMERVFVTVHKYGNMSSATVPVALVDALEEGRVKPGALILMPAFGAGLTWCSHLVRWGERVTPLDTSDVELPPCDADRARDGQRAARAQGQPRAVAGRAAAAGVSGDGASRGRVRRHEP